MFPHVYAYYERHAASTRKKTQDDLALTVAAEMKTRREKNLFRQDEGVPIRWMAEKDYGRIMSILNKEIKAQKEGFTKEELTDAYETYTNNREKQLQELQEEKWNMVTFFRELLEQPEYTQPLAGFDKALYETMFKAQPTKFVSRARFLTVMRLVYGFNIAGAGESYDRSMLSLLNGLYSSFDTLNEDKMDWRCFLFMVRVVHDYTDTPVDHLVWGFALFGSEGSLDLQDCGGVRLRDVLDLLLCLVLKHLGKTMEEIFNKSLSRLQQQSFKVHKLLEATQLAGKPRLETRISLAQFKDLLKCEPFNALFEIGLRHGPPDCSPWTYLIEEKFYHPKAVTYIWKKRRDERNERQARIFMNKANLRLKGKMVQMWWKYVWRRGRARYICQAMVIRYIARNSNVAMIKWRFLTMAPIVITEVQRVFRGFLGRLDAGILKKIHEAAITVQCAYRRRIVFVRYMAYKNRRNWAATEIQRHTRGILARRVAYSRVLAFVDNQFVHIGRERALLASYKLEHCATVIQTAWRRRMGVQLYKEMVAAIKRQRIVEEAMRQREMEEYRQKRIYQRAIESFYEQMRRDAIQKVYDDARVEEVKFDMRRRKRLRKWQAKEERKREEEQLQNAREQQLVVQFNEEWDQRRIDRANAVRKRVLKMLKDPDNDKDVEEAEGLEKLIKARMPLTMKELDKRGLRLETYQVHDVARDALIQEWMDEERLKVDRERKEAAVQFELDREAAVQRRIDEERAEHQRKQQRAATIIQVELYRNWKARKRVREVIFRRYKKKFDPNSHQYYYENTKTNTKSWKKPKTLYGYDLEVRDEWFEMSNDGKVQDCIEGLRYYYNPKSRNILWETPIGTVLCDTCKWNFSRKRARDRKHYCNDCWETAFKDDPERYKRPWKPVDGGCPTAAETSIEFIPDQFDEDPAVRAAIQAEYEAAQLAAAEELLRLQYEEQQLQLQQPEGGLQLDYYSGGSGYNGYYDQNGNWLQYDPANGGYYMYDGEGNYLDYIQYDSAAGSLGYDPAVSGGYLTDGSATASQEMVPWCQQCNAMRAGKYCVQCVQYYCPVCAVRTHPRMNPVMRTHQMQTIQEAMAAWQQQQQPVDEAGDGAIVVSGDVSGGEIVAAPSNETAVTESSTEVVETQAP